LDIYRLIKPILPSMKPTLQFDYELFKFCGQNCAVCMVHKMKKKPCLNCSGNCAEKIDRVLKCGIRICAEVKDNNFCKDCTKYPCNKLAKMNSSYSAIG